MRLSILGWRECKYKLINREKPRALNDTVRLNGHLARLNTMEMLNGGMPFPFNSSFSPFNQPCSPMHLMVRFARIMAKRQVTDCLPFSIEDNIVNGQVYTGTNGGHMMLQKDGLKFFAPAIVSTQLLVLYISLIFENSDIRGYSF